LETQKRWIANVIESGGEMVVEPWLERVMDFSAQLEMTHTGLKLCGYTGLINDARGQFQGNWAEPKHEKAFPAAVLAALQVTPRAGNEIQVFYSDLFKALEAEFQAPVFTVRWALIALFIEKLQEHSNSSRWWKSIRAIRWAG
jgi:hypothetical protein